MEKYYVKYKIWSIGSSVVVREETIENQSGLGLLGCMEWITRVQGKMGCKVEFKEAKIL